LFKSSGFISFTGSSRLKEYFRATASRIEKEFWLLIQPCMAPPFIDLSLAGISKSGSISCLTPRPVQVGQAPKGLLKEKSRGASSGRLMLQSGQAKFSLKTISLSPTATSTSPAACFREVSSESARRLSEPGRTIILSTTISTECFLFFSSFISSVTSRISPSTLILTKPFRRISSKSLANSPFFPLTTGAITVILEPSGSSVS